jgi:hypothetical protein
VLFVATLSKRGVDNGFVIYKRTLPTFPVRINWHTPKAMQSRVKMNDEYIALDCALLVCREPGIEARLRKKK